jgi:hypothetical protein
MKAIKVQYEEDDDGEILLLPDEAEDLAEAVAKGLDSVDFYTGQESSYVLNNLLSSYGRLIDALAEKGVLDVSDINEIVSLNINRIDRN